MQKLLPYLLVSILIIGCSSSANIQKAWDSTVKYNTINSYETFLSQYPDSKYSELARQKLETLYELEAWSKARRYNTISDYEKFILLHPNSPMKEKALELIDELNIEKEWNYTQSINTKEAYNNFISKHPFSTYRSKAQDKIYSIEENEAWNLADNNNSIMSYEIYLNNYPNGKYSNIAKNRIAEIKIILPEWNKTLKKNTLLAYQDFISKYPLSRFSDIAREKISDFEKAGWENALNKNSIKNYKKFIKDFPDSKYKSIAEGKIVDLEVDNIFSGDHGVLPPTTKVSENYNRGYCVISIYNSTEYTLTVRYSGNESFKVDFSPNEKGSIEMKNGKYRVTASVNASRVRDFAGNETLDGGDYNIVYYITTDNEDKSYKYQQYLNSDERYPTKRKLTR